MSDTGGYTPKDDGMKDLGWFALSVLLAILVGLGIGFLIAAAAK